MCISTRFMGFGCWRGRSTAALGIADCMQRIAVKSEAKTKKENKYAIRIYNQPNNAASLFSCLSKKNVPKGINAAASAFKNQKKFLFKAPIISKEK